MPSLRCLVRARAFRLAGPIVLLLAAPARGATPPAEAGDLDPGFGAGGILTTDLGYNGRAFAVALQPDGKIVAAGSRPGGFALARYSPDGSLDPTFGDGGTTAIGPAGEAHAVVLQSDGKIVADGNVAPGGYCCAFELARYDAEGRLDPTFGQAGVVITAFTGLTGISAVAIQADGKIVAAGATYSPYGGFFALARYNPDGSLDRSFDGDGKVTTAFGDDPAPAANALVIQPDGKLVAAGGSAGDFALARYNPDGSLDTSFGISGKVTTDFGGSDGAFGIALQTDGKIVAAGYGAFFTGFALARYDADGGLDSSFGVAGKVTTRFSTESVSEAKSLVLQPDGKIVAAGWAYFGSEGRFALARYETDGSLDADFGVDGTLTTLFGDRDKGEAEAVALQTDGKIVAAGGTGPCTPLCGFALARYLGVSEVRRVRVDVKPGTAANPVKPRSPVAIPVAVLSSPSFDATTVDPASVCFGAENRQPEWDCTDAKGGGSLVDTNGDGRLDLVLRFRSNRTGLRSGDTRACLEGTTFEGHPFKGCDSIRTTRPPGGPPGGRVPPLVGTAGGGASNR